MGRKAIPAAAPADDRLAQSRQAERDQIRQLTRELHEATQDARAAARELREERARVVSEFTDGIWELLNQSNKAINAKFAELGKDLEKARTELVEHQAEILGKEDSEQLLNYITERLFEAFQPILSEKLEQDIAATLPAYLRDFLGKGVKRAVRKSADAGTGVNAQILIATRDQLASIENPGLVIDLTSDE